MTDIIRIAIVYNRHRPKNIILHANVSLSTSPSKDRSIILSFNHRFTNSFFITLSLNTGLHHYVIERPKQLLYNTAIIVPFMPLATLLSSDTRTTVQAIYI